MVGFKAYKRRQTNKTNQVELQRVGPSEDVKACFDLAVISLGNDGDVLDQPIVKKIICFSEGAEKAWLVSNLKQIDPSQKSELAEVLAKAARKTLLPLVCQDLENQS